MKKSKNRKRDKKVITNQDKEPKKTVRTNRVGENRDI
jgi:hypothetical protein